MVAALLLLTNFRDGIRQTCACTGKYTCGVPLCVLLLLLKPSTLL
jgi:hypothetical protein